MARHYAVIGRIPFDDEDTCYIYPNTTKAEALKEFEADLYNDDDQKAEDVKEANGATHYVIHVLASESPITTI